MTLTSKANMNLDSLLFFFDITLCTNDMEERTLPAKSVKVLSDCVDMLTTAVQRHIQDF